MCVNMIEEVILDKLYKPTKLRIKIEASIRKPEIHRMVSNAREFFFSKDKSGRAADSLSWKVTSFVRNKL